MTPPLNMTDEEAQYLWEMMKEEVGKDSVQYSDDRSKVESLHTKVRRLVVEDTGTAENEEDP